MTTYILSDILPVMSGGGALDFFLGLMVVLIVLDRIVNIVSNLRSGKQDIMTRSEIRVEMARMQTRIEQVHSERRETTDQMFEEIKKVSQATSNSMNDVSRTLGRLEGSIDIAEAIRDGLRQLRQG